MSLFFNGFKIDSDTRHKAFSRWAEEGRAIGLCHNSSQTNLDFRPFCTQDSFASARATADRASAKPLQKTKRHQI